jgi:hypothetical protein
MTVGELKDILEDYGDHLPVIVSMSDGDEGEVTYRDLTITSYMMVDEPTVVVEI